MATLTETAYYTRRIVTIFVASLIGFTVFRLSFFTARDIWIRYNPPPPPPPTVEFGKLPQVVFPESEKPLPELAYRLETIGGAFTETPQSTKVYFMPQKAANLLALDRAKDKAKILGFGDEPKRLTGTTYRWEKRIEPPTTLEMDIISGSFYLRHLYEESPLLLSEKELPTNEQAIIEAKNFFDNLDLLTTDLTNGSGEVSYYRLILPDLIPVSSISEADFIRVDLFRADLGEYQIVPNNPIESPIFVLISGVKQNARQGERILEANYVYHPVSLENYATYPIKTIDSAWQELQGGEGYVANLGRNPEGQIVIRNAFLAYYDSEEKQPFLQPVYVFEGDGDFYAYVAAVSEEWSE
jgi:hypothetical protein